MPARRCSVRVSCIVLLVAERLAAPSPALVSRPRRTPVAIMVAVSLAGACLMSCCYGG